MSRARVLGAVAAMLASAAVSLAGATAATLRPLADGVTSVVSDGQRYLAWEATRAHGILFVLDTRTGRRRRLRTPCPLAGGGAAGRFLLSCGEDRADLLDVRTGAAVRLPELTEAVHPGWNGVGSRYAIGYASTRARCPGRRAREACLALYDIATGHLAVRPERLVPDPNRPGAPPVCIPLRRRVFDLSEPASEIGAGPLLLADGASYEAGTLVQEEGLLREEVPDPPRHLLVIHCRGPMQEIPLHPEPHHPEWRISDVELGAGLVTWDTGYGIEQAEGQAEAIGEAEADPLRHASLYAYDLASRRLLRWALPARILTGTRHFSFGGAPRSLHVRGVFGFSAHLSGEVVWVAEDSYSESCGVKTCSDPEREVSTIYTAPI